MDLGEKTEEDGAGLGRADLIAAATCCWTTAMMSSIDTMVGEGGEAAEPFVDFKLVPDGAATDIVDEDRVVLEVDDAIRTIRRDRLGNSKVSYAPCPQLNA